MIEQLKIAKNMRNKRLMIDNKKIQSWYEKNKEFEKNIEEVNKKISLWLSDTTEEQKQILFKLFLNSRFYGKKNIFSRFRTWYEQIKDAGYNIYTAIESQKYRHNSSHMFLYEFTLAVDVSEDDIKHSLKYMSVDEVKYVDNIIMMDDIIGTGKTVIDFFNSILEYLSGKTVYLWVLCCTEEALYKLKEYESGIDFKLEIKYDRIEKKAFCKDYVFNEGEIEHKKEVIENFEKNLWKKRRKNKDEFILGKDDSQCLVSFYNDTPNNTLSSFWYEDEKRQAIFKRKIKKKNKSTRLNSKKRKRREENYKAKENGYV